jgi:hypothetical protein
MSGVQRGQRVLDKIGARLGITQAGKEWLTAAVDPFHDTPLLVTGFPDVNEASSVVQVVRLSSTISAPSGVEGNWDVHIHQFPWQRRCNGSGGNWSNTVDGDQSTGFGMFLLGSSTTTPTPVASSTCNYGGLVYDAVASGNPTFVYNDTGSNVPFDTQLQPYLVGEYRVIAMGFEVVNTTSELNIQGLCTVYRQPCGALDSAKTVLVTSGATVNGSTTALNFGYPAIVSTSNPPANTAEALLLDGSKQWKAKDGCYVVPTFNSSENPAGFNPVSVISKLSKSDPTSNTFSWQYMIPGGVNIPAFQEIIIPISAANYVVSAIPTGALQFQSFNHSGAYFSGLSNSTTLQLNAVYYIERFPSQQDSALVVLARSSPRLDCVALDLYSEIMKEMPVGVPQAENGFGDWFADAVSSAADFVSPVLSAIPLPMTQTLSGMVKTAGNMAKSIAGKKEAVGQTYSATASNVSAPSKPKSVVTAVTTKKKVQKTKKKK